MKKKSFQQMVLKQQDIHILRQWSYTQALHFSWN